MAPLISVVVISYRHGDYIAKCLESIFQQEVEAAVEVIISDDNSPDDTWDVVNKFLANNGDLLSRNGFSVRAQSRPKNLGAIPNLRDAIQQARGKYIAICEGDDYWLESDKLSQQLQLLEEHRDVDVCFHPVQRGMNPIEAKPYRAYNAAAKLFGPKQVAMGGGSFMPSPSLFFRKDRLEEMPSWVWRAPVTDVYLQIFMSMDGGAAFLPAPMAFYRSGHAVSWSANQHGLQDRYEHLKQHRMLLAALSAKEQRRDAQYLSYLQLWLSKKYYRLAKSAFRGKSIRLSIKSFVIALLALFGRARVGPKSIKSSIRVPPQP